MTALANAAGVPCWFCNARFDTEQGRAIHTGKMHDGPKPRPTVECPQCGRRVQTRRGLQSHLGLVHGGTFSCIHGHPDGGPHCTLCARPRNAARTRAVRRLIEHHSAEYRKLLAEERAR